jgi:ribonuclease J
MFPDARHVGRRPRAARLLVAARAGRRHRRVHRSPTATRTTSERCPTCWPTLSFPIIGTRALSLGLAPTRIEEAGLLGRTEFMIVVPRRRAPQVRAVRLSSSPRNDPLGAPGASPRRSTPRRARSSTPATSRSTSRPVDGRLTDLSGHGRHRHRRGDPAAAGGLDQRRPVRPLALRDRGRQGALRPDARHTGPPGIVTACFASHIHRVQQIADAAIDGRPSVIAPLGRSMKQEREAMAREMGLLHIPDAALIDIEDDRRATNPVERCCVISTGSQGEPMSALTLIAGPREPLAQARHQRRHRDPVVAPRSPATSMRSPR